MDEIAEGVAEYDAQFEDDQECRCCCCTGECRGQLDDEPDPLAAGFVEGDYPEG